MSKYLLFVFLFFLSAPAFADCASPAGVNSQTRYDFAQHKMLYCNGSNWIAIPSNGGLGCVLDGVVVNDGSSFNFYSAQNHANCTTVRQSRLCTNGVLGGGATYQYASCSAADTTPDAFAFTDQTDVPRSTLTESNIVQITGITNSVSVSITGAASYRICSDTSCASVVQNWTSANGTVNNNQYIQLRATSSGSYATQTTYTMTVGSLSRTWNITSEYLIVTGMAGFKNILRAKTSTVYESEIVQLTGWTGTAPVKVHGGTATGKEYRICSNSTCSSVVQNWTASNGNITSGQYFQLRLTTSASYNSSVNIFMLVGDSGDGFSVKTGGPLGFYLSSTTHTGGNAANACAAGYKICDENWANASGNIDYYQDTSQGVNPIWGQTGFVNRDSYNCSNWASSSGNGVYKGFSNGEDSTGTLQGAGAICGTFRRVFCCEYQKECRLTSAAYTGNRGGLANTTAICVSAFGSGWAVPGDNDFCAYAHASSKTTTFNDAYRGWTRGSGNPNRTCYASGELFNSSAGYGRTGLCKDSGGATGGDGYSSEAKNCSTTQKLWCCNY